MSVANPPPALGTNWKIWGASINRFLVATRNTLQHKDSESKATEDGILMWDATEETVVVSKGGAWIKIQLDP